MPSPTFWAAELRCTPYYYDWGTLEGKVLHVYGAEIVPSSTYDVQATLEGTVFSDALTITTAKWGDVCGNSFESPPQGTVDFIDISAPVAKFKNDPGAPIKARCDLAGDTPDQKVDFVDISWCVSAFKGEPYPFPGPEEC